MNTLITDIFFVGGDSNMSGLIDTYRKTLKPKETEEFINSWLFRPAAFLIVWLVRNTKMTPNHLTIMSCISGITSGVMIALGQHILGFVAMFLMVVLDCADGQLARLTGKSSKVGKMLDVTADVTSYLSFFTGVSVFRYSITGNPAEFYFIPLSFIAIFFNIIFYDQFKNQYIRYVYPEYHEKLEDLNKLKEEYKNEKVPFFRFTRFVYYAVYLAETKVIYLGSIFALKKHSRIYSLDVQITKEKSSRYKKQFYFITRLWSVLGTGSHYFPMMVFLVLGYSHLLLYIFCLYSVIALAVLLIIQNFVFLFYKENGKKS